MTYDEQLEAARRAVRDPKPSSATALDAAALRSAQSAPRVVALSSLVGFLSGAPQQAQTANQYYQNASGQTGGFYGNALNNIVNSTSPTGSPAAQTFGAEESAALQPGFQQQQEQLAASDAAQGIGASGSGKYNTGQLASNQAATLAGAIAPLYASSLGTYNQGQLQGAGAQSGLVGQGAGAANQAYGNAINQFYGAADAAGGAYGGGGGGSSNPYSTEYSNVVPGQGTVGSNQASATYGSP
jgi:hypothetical protein